MSTTMNQTHIAYELLDETHPGVVVITFEANDFTDPMHGHELGEDLDALICPDLPMRYVIDFKGVSALGSTACCEIAAFARRVRWWGGRVTACHLDRGLSLGAALSGMDEHVEFADSLRSAISMARKDAGRLVFAS